MKKFATRPFESSIVKSVVLMFCGAYFILEREINHIFYGSAPTPQVITLGVVSLIAGMFFGWSYMSIIFRSNRQIIIRILVLLAISFANASLMTYYSDSLQVFKFLSITAGVIFAHLYHRRIHSEINKFEKNK